MKPREQLLREEREIPRLRVILPITFACAGERFLELGGSIFLTTVSLPESSQGATLLFRVTFLFKCPAGDAPLRKELPDSSLFLLERKKLWAPEVRENDT